MKNTVLALLATILLTSTTGGQIIPECVWNAHCDVLHHCVGGGNDGSGCDDSQGGCSGCFRGFARGADPLAVATDKKTGLLIVVNPGPLPDVKPGDQLRAIGSASSKKLTNLRTGRWLMRYTKTNPARSLRARVFRPPTGTWITSTWRTEN